MSSPTNCDNMNPHNTSTIIKSTCIFDKFNHTYINIQRYCDWGYFLIQTPKNLYNVSNYNVSGLECWYVQNNINCSSLHSGLVKNLSLNLEFSLPPVIREQYLYERCMKYETNIHPMWIISSIWGVINILFLMLIFFGVYFCFRDNKSTSIEII
jgi:hypothetical protein